MDALNRTKAAAMLLFTALAWGAMFAIAKAALHAIDAFYLTALRYVPASLVMLGVLAAVEGRRALRPDGAALRLWLYGSFGFAGFSILGFLGLTHTTPEHTAIIVSLMPLVTALVAWLWRGHRPSTVTIVSIAVAFAGVLLVITHGRPHLEAGDWSADGLVFAGVVCWSIYTSGASTVPAFSALRYTALSMALGTVTIVVVTLAASSFGIAPPARVDVVDLAPQIAYVAFVGGVLAVLAWNAGVGVLGAATASLSINLVPIVAFGIAIAQGRRVGAIEIAGVLLTIGALIASNLASRPAPARASVAALGGSVRPVRSAARN